MNRVLLGGRIVPASRASIPYLDRAVQFGFGLFETLRVYDGVPYLLDAHRSRLRRSAATLGLRLPREWGRLPRDVARLLAVERTRDAALKIVVTAGGWEGPRPVVAAHLRELDLPTRETYEEGVEVAVDEAVVRGAGRTAGHKTLNYLENYASRDYRPPGVYEHLFLDGSGAIVEGTVTNLFLVRGRLMFTPPLRSGALPGVTRAVLMEHFEAAGKPVREARITPKDLARADEAFLTNALIEVLPIGRFGRRRFEHGEATRHAAAVYSIWRRMETAKGTRRR